MIEVVGASSDGFSEAVENAVKTVSDSGKVIHFLEVVEQRGSVKDGVIREYQVKVKLAVE